MTGFDAPAAQAYGRYFSVVPANTPDLLRQAYRLRYQCYCLENQFEDASQHPDGLEKDAYDTHSVHALLVHSASGAVCGCVRLILPTEQALLPALSLLAPALGSGIERYPKAHTAEVSRYAITKQFRRRKDDNAYPDLGFFDTGMNARRLLPHLTIGLMIGVARMSGEHGIRYLTALMTPSLLRLLAAVGMIFDAVGPAVEHHGKRHPCIGSCEGLLSGIQEKHPAYATLLEPELYAGCTPLEWL